VSTPVLIFTNPQATCWGCRCPFKIDLLGMWGKVVSCMFTERILQCIIDSATECRALCPLCFVTKTSAIMHARRMFCSHLNNLHAARWLLTSVDQDPTPAAQQPNHTADTRQCSMFCLVRFGQNIIYTCMRKQGHCDIGGIY
jgi:hypothetical protein